MKTTLRRDKRPKVSKVTEESLLTAEKKETRRKDRPKALPLDEIYIADNVFQWRDRGANLAESANHLKELVRVLKATRKPLDPVVVTPVGNRFFLIEGHHRLDAYRIAKWNKPVPVKYFVGSVNEAELEALRLNIKDKLRMSRAEKFDAAFRLVKRHSKTYKEVSEITTVSLRTIKTMAKVLREHPEAANEATWRQAWWRYQLRPGIENERADTVIDWRETKARKLAEQLVKNVGVGFVRDADITARALEMIDENLPQKLVGEWFELASEAVVEAVRVQNNDLADQLQRTIIYGEPASLAFSDGEDEHGL